jgi:DNA-binding transcriptional LysR family regulator
MTDIDGTSIRRLDLTVLLVFLGLMRHRKATAVANELGLTQSAVSHSLKRLRDVFADELFLRRPHGLEPTAVATGLEEHISSAIENLRAALADPRSFDPSAAQHVVRVGAYDNELATIVPQLIQAIAREAPGLRLSARAIGRKQALEALTNGEIDLAVSYIPELEDKFVATALYEESYLVVGKKDEAALADGMQLDEYLALPHILVSPGGDLHGVVDDTLERQGLSRTIVAAVPQLFSCACRRSRIRLHRHTAKTSGTDLCAGVWTCRRRAPIARARISDFRGAPPT